MSQEEKEKEARLAADRAAISARKDADAAAALESEEKTKQHIEDNQDIDYFNVTQALVEDKALAYMKRLGMCCCPRCMADVKALALTSLAPKYIVMRKSEMTPMLSYYEGRLGAAVTAQIFAACQLVMDRPRH